jgi:Tfp pilus assembly protein PilE
LVVIVVVHVIVVVVVAAIHEMAYGDLGPVTEKDHAAAALTENACSRVHVEIVVVVIMVGVLVKAVMNARSSKFGCRGERSQLSAE